MPRKPPPPHPIEPYLKQKGLRATSIEAYARIARRIDASGLDAVEWCLDQVIISPDMPKRTLSVLRSASAWFAEWKDGTTREVSNSRLPKTRAQPKGLLRDPLEGEQIDAFYAGAERQAEPYRTILLLLLRTGMRISEACDLTHERYDVHGRQLHVMGKGGVERWVPLTGPAKNILDIFIERSTRDPKWLFVLPSGRRVRPRDVRRVTTAMSLDDPTMLYRLCPHRCRHTTATELLRANVNIKVIQDLLGHASIKSLDPYLRTSGGQRRSALESIERGAE